VTLSNGVSAYRLLVITAGRRRLFEDTGHATYEAAQGRVRAAVEALGDALQAVELQRAAPAEGLAYDEFRVIPGERGGWSAVRWTTVRRWDRSVVDRIARQTRLAVQAAPRNERTWIYTLGVSAVAVLAFAGYLVQSGYQPGTPTGLVATGHLEELPPAFIERGPLPVLGFNLPVGSPAIAAPPPLPPVAPAESRPDARFPGPAARNGAFAGS
jgi:hypothetical protein